MSDFKILITRALNFRARAQRREFFVGTLYLAAISVFVYQMAFIFNFFGKGVRFLWAWYLPIVLIYFSLKIKRMHDVGRCFVFAFIPVIGLALTLLNSQPVENQWGLSPKHEYHLTDFEDSQSFYRYLDTKLRFKSTTRQSLFHGLVWLLVTVSITSIGVYATKTYHVLLIRHYDLECTTETLRFEFTDNAELSRLSAREVVGVQSSVCDSLLLFYECDECEQSVEYKTVGDCSYVEGCVKVSNTYLVLDGYMRSTDYRFDTESRLKEFVESELQCIGAKPDFSVRLYIQESFEYLYRLVKDSISSREVLYDNTGYVE